MLGVDGWRGWEGTEGEDSFIDGGDVVEHLTVAGAVAVVAGVAGGAGREVEDVAGAGAGEVEVDAEVDVDGSDGVSVLDGVLNSTGRTCIETP